MLSKKDTLILSYLRKNAREKITSISRKTDIPATTIYDRLKKHNQSIINKHVAILDFAKLGYPAVANISINSNVDSREELKKYLVEHPNVNSLYRVNGADFLTEVVFRKVSDIDKFVQKIGSRFNIKDCKVYNIVDSIKKEDFLTQVNHYDAK